MSNFYKNYVELCAENGYSVSGAATAIGLSNAAANGWKSGKVPRDTTIKKLAKLFNCSIERLTGNSEGETAGPAASDVPAAFYGINEEGLSQEEHDELWADVRAYYEFKKQQIRERKKGR